METSQAYAIRCWLLNIETLIILDNYFFNALFIVL